MLEQLSRIIHDNESKHVEIAVRDYFIRIKAQYREAFGPDYWQQALDSMSHIDRLKIRRKVIKVDD